MGIGSRIRRSRGKVVIIIDIRPYSKGAFGDVMEVFLRQVFLCTSIYFIDFLVFITIIL